MAETNPLFATEAMPDMGLTWGVRSQAPSQRAPVHQRLVDNLRVLFGPDAISAITLPTEKDALIFDVELPASTAKRVVRAMLVPQTERLEYLTVDDVTHWQHGHYEPRNLRGSEATAFSEIEAVRDPPAANLIRHLVRYLRSMFEASYGHALAERIETLADMLRDEPEGAPLSGASLASFISFLEQHPTLVRPNTATGPIGEIIAIWRRPDRGEFTARFLPNGTVRFLLNIPNHRHPQRVSRLSGDTTTDRLFEEAGLRELKWILAG